MSIPIFVAPIASFALADAASAYEVSRAGYGRLYLLAFEETSLRLAQFPESSPLIDPGVRRALFPRPFPFCVLYRLVGIPVHRIEIVDVLPTAANPARWAPGALHRGSNET